MVGTIGKIVGGREYDVEHCGLSRRLIVDFNSFGEPSVAYFADFFYFR